MSAAADAIKAWRADPVVMVRELFGVEPDTWQVEALRAFADPSTPRIAMQACAGPGKSTVLAWCGWNFLLCYADVDQHPNGAAVSITGENLKNGLWKELAVWYSRSKLLQAAFDMTAERIFARDHAATWFLSARSFAKSADMEEQGRTLSGLHAPYILYLLDETGDMNPAVGRSAEQGLGNCVWGKIVQAGNTTSQQGYLHLAASSQRHLWHLISITADPAAPNRTPRVSIEWAQQQIDLYGRDNPWVMAYVLGQYPPGGLNTLLTADEVNAALGRNIRLDAYSGVQKRLGIDVARFGDDRTVIFPRQGLAAFTPVEMRGARTNEIAARVSLAKMRWGSEVEFIDSTGGWSAGVEDQCLLAGQPLLTVNFSGKASDSRYYNKRSEMYFHAAEWIKRGACLPNIPSIVPEATAATYWFDNGKLRVEEKDQIKARIGRSPDLWDALLCTFAHPDQPSNLDEMPGFATAQSHALTDYEPFSR